MVNITFSDHFFCSWYFWQSTLHTPVVEVAGPRDICRAILTAYTSKHKQVRESILHNIPYTFSGLKHALCSQRPVILIEQTVQTFRHQAPGVKSSWCKYVHGCLSIRVYTAVVQYIYTGRCCLCLQIIFSHHWYPLRPHVCSCFIPSWLIGSFKKKVVANKLSCAI